MGHTKQKKIVLITQITEWSVVVEGYGLDDAQAGSAAIGFVTNKLSAINTYKRLPFYVCDELKMMDVVDAETSDAADMTI